MSKAIDYQQEVPILPAVFHRPPVGSGYVERQRLEQRIRCENRAVLLIVAPAGYGKSTLASRYAESSEDPVTWISLSDSQDNVRTFLYALALGWNDLYPQAAERLRQFAGSEEPASPDAILASVSAELTDDQSPSFLILDDYHRIHDIDVHDLVDALLTHLLHRLKIIILSRSSPALRLGRLRSQGQVTEFRQRDLNFTLEEIRRFVSRAITTELDDQTLQQLQALTEGWPAGLRLILLAADGQADVCAFLNSIKGSVWQIEDYLLEEVIDGLEDSARDILLRTALLESFSKELIDASIPLGGEENSAPGALLMEVLQSRGMFSIPLDSTRTWFRFHHLFHELLQRHALAALPTDQIRSVKMRAAEWLHENGFVEESVKLLMDIGETGLASDIVSTHGTRAINDQNAGYADRLLNVLPQDTINKHFSLLVLQAYCAMWASRYTQISSCVRKLEKLAGESGSDQEQTETDDARLQLLKHNLKFLSAEFQEIIEEEVVLPRELGFERATSIMLKAAARQLTGDHSRARDVLYAALEESETDCPAYRVRIMIGLCFVHWYAGELLTLKEIATSLLREGQSGQDDFAIIYALWFKAAAEYFLNDLDGARETLRPIEQRSWWPHQHSYVNCMRIAAAIHMAESDIDNMEKILPELFSHQFERNTTTWLPELLASQADAGLLAGRDVEAFQWAMDYELGSITMPHGFGTASMVAAKLLLREGSKEAVQKAGQIIEANEAYFSNVSANRFVLEVLILRALHSWKTANMDKAVAKLTDAVLLAKPNQNIRIFADFGPDIVPLLSRVQLDDAHLRFVGEILRATRANRNEPQLEHNSSSRKGNDSASFTLETISRREMEVLELVSRNFTYKEIAEKLYISPATVKRHTHNIYGKLDVNGRRAAVAKASGLGIV